MSITLAQPAGVSGKRLTVGSTGNRFLILSLKQALSVPSVYVNQTPMLFMWEWAKYQFAVMSRTVMGFINQPMQARAGNTLVWTTHDKSAVFVYIRKILTLFMLRRSAMYGDQMNSAVFLNQ